jgi:hypothetical protein
MGVDDVLVPPDVGADAAAPPLRAVSDAVSAGVGT